jgi:hypothetical protein
MAVDIGSNRAQINVLKTLLDTKKSNNDVGNNNGQGASPAKTKTKEKDGQEEEGNVFTAALEVATAVLRFIAKAITAIGNAIVGALDKDHSKTEEATAEKFSDSDPAAIEAEIERLEQEIKDQEKKDAEGPEQEGNGLFARMMKAFEGLFGGAKESEKSAEAGSDKKVLNLEDSDGLGDGSEDNEETASLDEKEARAAAKNVAKGMGNVTDAGEHDAQDGVKAAEESHVQDAAKSTTKGAVASH